VTNIEELQAVIRRIHGADAFHIKSVPVKETFSGKRMWEGVVEVFDLVGHPKAFRIYAWTNAGSPRKLHRHVTVLRLHSIRSARDAVRATVTRQFRNLEPAELQAQSWASRRRSPRPYCFNSHQS